MLEINCQQESKNIIQWVQNVLKESGLKNLVIGLSGGVDSATSATLATRAVGADNMFIAMMPYGNLHQHGLEDAKLVTDFLGIPKGHVFVFDIRSAVDTITNFVIPTEEERRVEGSSQQSKSDARDSSTSLRFARNDNTNTIRKGNIMARVRMIYLFDLAKRLSALVCGTENRSEHYLGYFTRFGDEASDMEPVRHLYKTQIWEMAQHVGLPEKIITKAPTAGLWEEQTDEGEFGFSYKEADQVLYYHFDQSLSKDEIIAKGLNKELVEKVFKRVKENQFKHHLPFVYR